MWAGTGTGTGGQHGDEGAAGTSNNNTAPLNIGVETVTGTRFTMCVCSTDTVLHIKNKIARVEGIPVSKQHLIYNYKELEDFTTLSDNSIGDGSTVRLVLSMHGGPISTRRLPSVDDIQWRDIRDFFENNRDEAFDWLPPGCRFLVYRDGDNVNIVKVVEDDADDTYILENDYYFSEESAAHKCKMLDLRCKMEKSSSKRNKSKNNSKDDNKPSTSLQKSTSEEALSSTLDGLFGEPPKTLTYRPRRLYHHTGGDSVPTNSDSCGKMPNKNVFSDIWSPISGFSNVDSSDNGVASSKGWPTASTSYFSRPASASNERIDSFKDSVLASTSNSVSYSNARTNIETVCVDPFQEPTTLKKTPFVSERSLVKNLANEVLEAETIESTESTTSIVKTNVAGIAPLVLETQSVGTLQLPSASTSQGPLLLAHASNTACNLRNDYHVAQILGKDSQSDPEGFDNQQYYYQQSGPIKRVMRKVIFGSNSQLNSLPEVHESKEASSSKTDLVSPGAYVQPLIGSEPQLDKLADSSSIADLCNSVSNLYVNAQCKSTPCSEFNSNSELNKNNEFGFSKKLSGIKPSSMIFSSSTSDLLNMKRNKILPSLSRHRNSEHLDTSIENMDKVTITKQENPYCSEHINSRIQMDDVIYGKERRYRSGSTETEGPSSSEWRDSYFREKLFGGKSYVTNFDSQSRKMNDACHGIDDRSSGTTVHNIHLIPNKENDCINRLFSNQSSSHRHLEVGSERRFRRIKKNSKQDQEKSNRKFLLGYGNQGYEATIYKMPNDCVRIEQTANDKYIPSPDKKLAADNSGEAQTLPSLMETETPKKNQRMRCAMCKKRLTIATVHTCRCGIVFCAPHRYAEVHGCQYDYKAEGQEYLRKVNPLVSAPKLPKI